MEQIARLRRGDTVAIAAPARSVTPRELEAAIDMLSSWGLEAYIPEGLFFQEGQMAGSDAHRAKVMQCLLDDDSVKAIFCARGGYGSVRLIDRLDFRHFVQRPKWIVGYSDITVFHSHIHSQFGLPTLHATMPINFPQYGDNADVESLRCCLMEGEEPMPILASHHSLDRQGEAEGVVVGGNLSILYSLCGSRSMMDTRGKILLIEDLDEYLYHIDRMMQNLKRCGMLEELNGLIVGGMTQMHDNQVSFGKDAEQIIREAVEGYDYPVAFSMPIGHSVGNNYAIRLGEKYCLKVGDLKKSCIFAN